MIGKTISHYKILSELGRGGMGVVYKAQDLNLDRFVAIKVLPPHLSSDEEAINRFVHEAKAASSLDHSNIGTLYEVDRTEDGQVFLVMAYYEGNTLREYVDRGDLNVHKSLDIASQIAAGLARAHETDIVHRDIKPSNIIVTNRGEVKILDFGLAKLAGKTKLTKEGSTIGTAAYMSPEQARGEEVDHRSDIFSLGAILYEMLCGVRPFKGEHEAALLYEIVHEEPEKLSKQRPGLPEVFQEIIDKALKKNPDDRYATASDMLRDITIIRTTPIAGGEADTAKKNNLRRIMSIAGIIILIVIAGYITISRFIFPPPGDEKAKRIAVLPFENLGPPEDGYFADGITDEITARLAIVRGLSVIARTSAVQYKDTEKSIEQIGKELNVNYILEGTIRWQRLPGDKSQVRVTPQLVRVSDESHLWAHIYQEDLSDIFEVQSSIAMQVVEALNVTLLEPERRAIETRPTENIDAYQAYLKGLEYRWASTRRESDFRMAIEMFERSVELDPKMAQSYAELSMLHSYMYHEAYDRSEEQPINAKEAADRVIALKPDIPEAHMALGYYYYYCREEFERALDVFSTANERFPNNSSVLFALGLIYRRLGDFAASADYLERAFELSPRESYKANEVAVTYRFLRKYEDALRYDRFSISITPHQSIAYERMASTYWLYTGDLEAARTALEHCPPTGTAYLELGHWLRQELYERNYMKALEIIAKTAAESYYGELLFVPKSLLRGWIYDLVNEPELAHSSYDDARVLLEAEAREHPDDERIRSSLGLAYAGLGRKEEAIREGELGLELCPLAEDAIAGTFRLDDLTLIYTMVGEYDKAFDRIERLLSIPSLFSVPLLRVDPRYDPLRDQPRYQEILEKYSNLTE